MEDEKNITDKALPANADGSSAVLNPVDGLNLAELNTLLGKNFPDKETALKSIQDTFSYVGKKKEDIAKEIGTAEKGDFVTKAEFLQEQFYANNPDFKPYKAIIAKLGDDPSKVIEDPAFKQIFSNASQFDKIETSKSVLHSNPRLSKVTDNLKEAHEAIAKGDYRTAENKAVESVIDLIRE